MLRKLFGFGRKNRSTRRRAPAPKAVRPRSRRPLLEALETREAPVVNSFVDGFGVLQILSDNMGNVVTVNHVGAITSVNFFMFPDAAFHHIRLQGGTGGDTDNILATPAKRPLTIFGAGLDTVNVGNAATGVQGIQSLLTIRNPPSFSTVNLNDCGDTAPRSVTMSVSPPTGLISGLAPAPINYSTNDLNALNIVTGTGGTTFFILSTARGIPVTLNSCGAMDTVNVGNEFNGMQDILGPLNINNTPSFSAVTFDDCADPFARNVFMVRTGANTDTVTGLAPATITLTVSDVSSLTVISGTGGDTFHFDPFFAIPVTFLTCGGADSWVWP
jgi:hypothetical protein